MSIIRKIIAFCHLVELTTVNRWLTASVIGSFYLTDTYKLTFSLFRVFSAVLGLMLVLFYVMAINDCFDVEEDQLKSKLGDKKLVVSVEISPNQALFLSLAMLITGLIISLFVSLVFFLVVVSMALLSTLYSVPPIRYKERFPFSTLGELLGSFLLFLSGFSILGFIDLKAMFVSTIFSLVTMYWRFVHETQFCEVDQQSGKTTFAVVYGAEPTRILAKLCLLFLVIAFLTLFALGWLSIKFSLLLGLYLFFAMGYWYRFINYVPKFMKSAIGPIWGFFFIPIAVVLWIL